jgi:ArsR family transcriptional regulator
MGAMSEAALEEVARYFRVLAEPTRLKILQVLCTGEKNVTQVIAETGGDPANISQQLRILWNGGILSRRSAGTSAIYAITDPTVFKLCEIVCDHLVVQMANRMNIRDQLREPQHNR